MVPISLLTHQHPELITTLEHQLLETPSPRHNKIALRLQDDSALLSELTDLERQAWQMLGDKPLALGRLAERDRPLARALGRLERKGLVIYTGFTPSDAAHVLKLCNHWCRRGAALATAIWARQMRWIYGYGNWDQEDIEAPSREVLDAVIATISHKIIEAGLHEHDLLGEARSRNLASLLTDLIVHGQKDSSKGGLFQVRFGDDRPIVAVGAPAFIYYPEVAMRLGVRLDMPAHAEVANAVGAVMGSVTQRVHVAVSQISRGTYRVFSRAGPVDFHELDRAIAHAQQLALSEAVFRAREAGADTLETQLAREDNSVNHDIDGYVFFDARITATASGRPSLQTDAESSRETVDTST